MEMTRVCLLTGASGTFGRAFIERCAPEWRIVAVHHTSPIHYATQDQSLVDPLAPETPLAAPAVHAMKADLSRPEEISRVVTETLAEYGRIDLLVNAAAVRHWGPLLSPESLDSAGHMLDLNVLVPLRFALAVAQGFWMADPDANIRDRRNVVNISSTAGLYVYPDTGQALYATSKAALNHLTYHMATEFWDLGVRVNAVAPDTFPGRVAVSEVVDAVLALDKSEATGEVAPV